MKRILIMVFLVGAWILPFELAAQEPSPKVFEEGRGKALIISAQLQPYITNGNFNLNFRAPQLGYQWHNSPHHRHRVDFNLAGFQRVSTSIGNSAHWGVNLGAGYEYQYFFKNDANAKFQPYLGLGGDVFWAFGKTSSPLNDGGYHELALVPKVVPGFQLNLGKRIFLDVALPIQPIAVSEGIGNSFPVNFNVNSGGMIRLRTGLGIRF